MEIMTVAAKMEGKKNQAPFTTFSINSDNLL